MIFVFKTSVKTKRAANRLSPFLNELFTVGKWNFDLEDCDKILRVDCDSEIALRVIALLQANRFQCDLLPD
jgi:hypothetical protein